MQSKFFKPPLYVDSSGTTHDIIDLIDAAQSAANNAQLSANSALLSSKNVSETIGGKALGDIFETDGTTVKNATNAQTQAVSDNSTKIATTAFAQNLTADNRVKIYTGVYAGQAASGACFVQALPNKYCYIFKPGLSVDVQIYNGGTEELYSGYQIIGEGYIGWNVNEAIFVPHFKGLIQTNGTSEGAIFSYFPMTDIPNLSFIF